MLEHFLICAYILTIVVSFALVVKVFFQVPSREQKILQILILANWLVAMGNVISVMAAPDNGAVLGDKIIYIGGSFLAFSYFLFCSTICKKKIKKVNIGIMLCINLFFILAVVFDDWFHVVYRDIVFYKDGLLTYSKSTYGWMFYLYFMWQFFYLVHVFLLLIQCRKKSPLLFSHLKTSLRKFLLCGVLALVPYLLVIFFNLEVEVTGISTTLAAALLLWILNRDNVYPLRVNSKDNIIDEMDDIFIVTTVEGGYEYANERARKAISELETFPYGMKINGVSKMLDSVLGLEDNQTMTIGERIFRKKTLPFEFDGKHLGDIHWLRDETVITKYVEEIIHLKDEADRANEAKSTFLAHMSHEIRTPINGVLGLDEMLMRESTDPQTVEYAAQIMRTGKTLLAIINDVLDFSKIEAGKMVIVEAPYSPKRMFDDILLSVEARAEEKGLAIQTRISESVPPGLMGDEIRVKQIITNLMTNAVKYTEKGSIILKAEYYNSKKTVQKITDELSFEEAVERRTKATGILAVSVCDTGTGIKQEDMGKLFSSFERIENMATHKTEGTGLGMSITNRLLKLMGGKLEVESVYGKGSVFSVIIPQCIVDYRESTLDEDISKKKEAMFIAPEADILIVDDNRTNLLVAKGLLKRNLVRVDVSQSGADCLDKISKKHYDIIMLDRRMPDMDGIDTFEEMKKIDHCCKGVPIVMMTADADAGAREYYLGLGMTDYISKPINSVIYENMVARLLPPEKVIYNKNQ